MSNYLVSANDLTTISLGEQDTVTSVLQNIAVILSTPKGTVPCYREFGIDIANILDGRKTWRSLCSALLSKRPSSDLNLVLPTWGLPSRKPLTLPGGCCPSWR